MSGINSSAYLRLPFNVTNTAAINSLTLRVRYDDGFAAFLNGALVASDNAPAVLDWNSSATNRHPTADALQLSSFDLTAAIGYLQNGANVLALQGLNVSATNADFLLQVELEADGYQYSTDARYFTQPTPGAPNMPGVKDLGPILSPDGFSPALPGTNDSITVTCVVAQAFAPVTNVTLNWRVMYGALQQTPMYDDGLHGDGAAGDGVYGAIITNHVGANWTYAAGEMVRWYVTAAGFLVVHLALAVVLRHRPGRRNTTARWSSRIMSRASCPFSNSSLTRQIKAPRIRKPVRALRFITMENSMTTSTSISAAIPRRSTRRNPTA